MAKRSNIANEIQELEENFDSKMRCLYVITLTCVQTIKASTKSTTCPVITIENVH